jgi:hypothetical protein
MTTWSKDKPDFMGRPSGLIDGLPRDERRALGAPLSPARGLARFIPEGVRRRIVEAMGGGSLLGQWQGGTGDEDFSGYRPLGQRIDGITRDLDAWTYDRQIRMALYLYATNPLAAWLIDNLVDVTLGQRVGFTFAIDAEKANLGALGGDNRAQGVVDSAQQHLATFWTHPAHSLDTRAREYATTHLVTGALLLPVTFAELAGKPIDGLPMLDLIDAQQIAKVESADKSAMVPGKVWYRAPGYEGDSKPIEVIRQRERGGILEGQAFYFPHRKLLNQLMGTSYLLDVVDWLDRHDQFLFNALDRGKLANAFAWLIKMEGFTEAQCIAYAKKLKTEGLLGGPGSVVVTNAKGGLEAVSPNLQSGDVDIMARTFRLHILGSKSRPESWYASGGETNRATAGDQTDVAYKNLQAWQDTFRGWFETMLAFAYDQGRAAQGELRRSWPERSSGAVTIAAVLPNVKERDYVKAGEAVDKIATGLESGISGELISRKTSRSVFLSAAAKLSGTEIDQAKEEALIEGEAEEREKKAAEIANQRMAAALDQVPGRSPGGEPEPDADEAAAGEAA